MFVISDKFHQFEYHVWWKIISIAVLKFWIHIVHWGNDWCHFKWVDCWFHWSKMGKNRGYSVKITHIWVFITTWNFSHKLISLWVESSHENVIHGLYCRMDHGLLIFCMLCPLFSYNFDIFMYTIQHVYPSSGFNIGICFSLLWQIFTRIWYWCFFLRGMLFCATSLLGYVVLINM